jgi:large subunit ribosomal protein L24
MHIKKGDNVIVLSGKDKGKSGKILRAFPKDGQVIIEGVNIRKVAEKTNKKDTKKVMVEKAYPVDASNVKLKN